MCIKYLHKNVFLSACVCSEGKCENVCVIDLKSHVLSLVVCVGWSVSVDYRHTPTNTRTKENIFM
jgi:hypothetical protein